MNNGHKSIHRSLPFLNQGSSFQSTINLTQKSSFLSVHDRSNQVRKLDNFSSIMGEHRRSKNHQSTNNLPSKLTMTSNRFPSEANIFEKFEPNEFERLEMKNYPEVYYSGSKCKSTSLLSNDDDEKFYIMRVGDHIHYRFEIVKVLGKGSFGNVCEAWDHKRKKKVAIKMLRNDSSIIKQAHIEIKILVSLRNSEYHANIYSSFTFRNHICIVFELLDSNLYDILKYNNFRGLSVGVIRKISKNILTGLNVLLQKGIIHCDLKPENILLKEPHKTAVKIIDFGSGCFTHKKVFSYIQSRYYRAPEIILRLPYSAAIDIWSFGCILFELYTGFPLFPGESEYDMYFRIIEVIGPPPKNFVERSSKASKFCGNKLMDSYEKNGKKRTAFGKKIGSAVNDRKLTQLIYKCLKWTPEERLTPSLALKHSFFAKSNN